MARKKEKGKSKKKLKAKSKAKAIELTASPYDTLISESAPVLRNAVESYIIDCENYNERLTITGMALALGLTRQSLVKFDKSDDKEVIAVIDYAKQRVEEQLEQRLSGNSPSGAAFNLKANFGWQEVTKLSVGGGASGDDPIPVTTTIDPKQLSTEALKELMAAKNASTQAD